MEQHAAVAAFGPDGKLTLWSSTQTPHYVHRALAKVLEMPPAHIRVIACPNGGGFGGKSDPFGHEIVAGKLSMKTGRPVKITLTREEVFYCHRGRHPVKMWIRTGLKKDGTITAMHFRSALDGGGYGSYGVASLYYTGALQTVTYKIPRYKFEGVRVFTNKPPCGPKRGHGTPQPRYALECHIDKFCHDLGLDPSEWRLRNTLAPGTITANQMKVRTIGLRACLEQVIERSGWNARSAGSWGRGGGSASPARPTSPVPACPSTGTRCRTPACRSRWTAAGEWRSSAAPPTSARARTRCSPTWSRRSWASGPEDVRVVTADTDLTPVDLGSYSSRVTLMTGNAAIQAARRVRAQIFEAAARKLEVPADRLLAADRKIWDAADPSRALPFRGGRGPGRGRVRDARGGGLLQAAEERRPLEGRGRGSDAHVLVLRGGGGAERGPRDGDHPRSTRSGSPTTWAVPSTRCS